MDFDRAGERWYQAAADCVGDGYGRRAMFRVKAGAS